MSTATLTRKGQTTIPKDVREHLGLQPGDRLEFVVEDNVVILRPATRKVIEVKGFSRSPNGGCRSGRWNVQSASVPASDRAGYQCACAVSRTGRSISGSSGHTLDRTHPRRRDAAGFHRFGRALRIGLGVGKQLRYPRKQIAEGLQKLFEIDRFRLEVPELAWRALDGYRAGADFADALLARVYEVAVCDYTASFDQRAASRIKQVGLLTR